ncbi:colanic acid biosynthesis glycosyl transferase [Aminobacter sp. DSM 101952]|uniref:glycosyltransferase n=1 Tax=Aminobacter sp. DSM 101952 TaxID=2735891 RepID=UPI0006F69C31|nr:glycosyltransferase [Aminobacter sp. DSM 101952]KQU73749.1 colanic acid biosynthesis glycosyl transferase [Aminobacter sp. DSM 101952]
MKVCFVVDRFPSLSETFVLDQIEGCLERGIEVGVVCNETTFGKERNIDDPRWRNLPGGVEQWWGALGPLRPALRKWSGKLWDKASTALDIAFARKLEKYDVIVAHFGNNGLRVARSMKRRRIAAPLVTIFHGHDVGAPMHDGTLSRYEVVFRHGALQLPVNGFFRKALIEAGAAADTVAVHHMGVDTDTIGFQAVAREEAALSLISVCRLTEKKGIEFALRALGEVQAKRPDIEWTYTVIGGGELLDAMKQLAAKLGISQRVAFLGPRPHSEVKQRLSEAHVFLLPSVKASDGDVEGIPVALMEAMAAGLTVVSTYHSGIPELIEDGRTGLLAPERDVEALAQKLAWIADNPQACAQLAVAARRKIEDDFDSVRLNDAFADTLFRLAATRAAA